MNKVLVVGYSAFEPGFQLVFDSKPNLEFIEKEKGWDKMSLGQRARYASQFDVIHFFWAKVTFGEILRLKLFNFKLQIILHFIGSDVLLLGKKKRRIFEYNFYKFFGVKYFADHVNLINSLKKFNITAELLSLINNKLEDNQQPLPKKFSVLAYVPKGKETFYHLETILRAAEKLPEINFTILGNDVAFSLKNVVSLPFASNIIEVMNQHSVFVRLTEHDGLPCSLLEALSCARHVVWSFDHEFCLRANSVAELVLILAKLKQENTLNIPGKEFVLKNYQLKSIRDKFYRAWGIEPPSGIARG